MRTSKTVTNLLPNAHWQHHQYGTQTLVHGRRKVMIETSKERRRVHVFENGRCLQDFKVSRDVPLKTLKREAEVELSAED